MQTATALNTVSAETLAARSAAARKAWATRRAAKCGTATAVVCRPNNDAALNAEIAANLAKAKQIAEANQTPETDQNFQLIELFVDDAKIGCGFRRLLVLEKTRKTVRLFYIPLLTAITVTREYFNDNWKNAKNASRKIAGEFIRKKIDQYESFNEQAQREVMKYDLRAVDQALALCA